MRLYLSFALLQSLEAISRCRLPRMAMRSTELAQADRRLLLGRGRLNLFHVDQSRWISSGVAGGAVGSLLAVGTCFLQSVQREIGHRIGSDVRPDLINCLIRCDQFFFGRCIYAVKAGRDRRRAGDAHVNFSSARVADHAHDLSTGSAANDGVIDQDHAFAFQQLAYWIQLELDAKIAHVLPRLNESASNVVIADEAELKWNAAFGCVTDCSGNA